jgi:hypothetical protein
MVIVMYSAVERGEGWWLREEWGRKCEYRTELLKTERGGEGDHCLNDDSSSSEERKIAIHNRKIYRKQKRVTSRASQDNKGYEI